MFAFFPLKIIFNELKTNFTFLKYKMNLKHNSKNIPFKFALLSVSSDAFSLSGA